MRNWRHQHTSGTGSFNSGYLHPAAPGPCCDVWCCDMVWLCCVYREMQTRSISLIQKEWGLWRFSRMQRFPQQLMPVFQFPGKLSIALTAFELVCQEQENCFFFSNISVRRCRFSPWKVLLKGLSCAFIVCVYPDLFLQFFFQKYNNIVTRTNN